MPHTRHMPHSRHTPHSGQHLSPAAAHVCTLVPCRPGRVPRLHQHDALSSTNSHTHACARKRARAHTHIFCMAPALRGGSRSGPDGTDLMAQNLMAQNLWTISCDRACPPFRRAWRASRADQPSSPPLQPCCGLSTSFSSLSLFLFHFHPALSPGTQVMAAIFQGVNEHIMTKHRQDVTARQLAREHLRHQMTLRNNDYAHARLFHKVVSSLSLHVILLPCPRCLSCCLVAVSSLSFHTCMPPCQHASMPPCLLHASMPA